MADKLDMNAINALQHPLSAVMIGGSRWPIYDIDVETGLMRLDVVGKLDVSHFVEVRTIIDGDHGEHDPEQFWKA